jgi:membrane associated rhomboid family serine protease
VKTVGGGQVPFPDTFNKVIPLLVSLGYEEAPTPDGETHWRWLVREEPLLRRVIILADESIDTSHLRELIKLALTTWRKTDGLFRIGVLSANPARDLGMLADISWVGAIWNLHGFSIRLLYTEGRWDVEDGAIRRRLNLKNQAVSGSDKDRVNIYSRPIWTYILMAANIAMFIWATLRGGSDDPRVLLALGAKDAAKIWLGEYWRLLTPLFIHIGYTHLFFNSFALFQLGPIVERLYGRLRFILIYLFAGIIGVLASIVGMPFAISAGASGSIFGLLGTLVYFSLRKPRAAKAYFGQSIWVMLVVNLALGFFIKGIDNYAHIGGLLGGFILAGGLGLGPADRLPHRGRWLAMVLVGSIVLGFFALNPPASGWHIPYDQGRVAHNMGDYELAIDQLELSLSREKRNDYARRYLVNSCLMRAIHLIDTGGFDGAVSVLKRGIAVKETWELRLLLGQAYYYSDQRRNALDEFKRAYQLNPKDKGIKEDIDTIEKELQ